MDKDWTKRSFRPVFRFGNGENKGNSGLFSPFDTGTSEDKLNLPLPTNPVLGAGKSHCIDASMGKADPWWKTPSSGVENPKGGIKSPAKKPKY